ncbi:MAG: DoxX family protein [Balneolaceae bacterium]|nr:DoxX family protein [Balneolaceae bacterium]
MLQRLKSTDLKEFVDTDISLLILRLFTAFFMFLGHGWGKLTNVFTGNFPAQFDPIGLGPEVSLILSAFAEGICAILIMVGFYTRAAAIFLIVNMSVAFLFVHISDPFGRMEMALVYLVIFLSVFLLGPGKYSIDGKMKSGSEGMM